jgi:demethoxyubiquinone hydroxylase (CLK1/Coq7/Cat5 family)
MLFFWPPIEERIRNLRSTIERVGEDAPMAVRYRTRIRELESKLAELSESPEHHFPAIENWRLQVLEERATRTPLEVAAAWEATAFMCAAVGDLTGETTAMGRARMRLLPRETPE